MTETLIFLLLFQYEKDKTETSNVKKNPSFYD